MMDYAYNTQALEPWQTLWTLNKRDKESTYIHSNQIQLLLPHGQSGLR